MDAIQGDKLRGHLEAMILSTLERDEAHGLEILHRLEEAGCGLLRLKEGSLYPALYRLEAADEVKAVWESGRSSESLRRPSSTALPTPCGWWQKPRRSLVETRRFITGCMPWTSPPVTTASLPLRLTAPFLASARPMMATAMWSTTRIST
jgi:hypothetical protein